MIVAPEKQRQRLQRTMHGLDDDLLALEDLVHDQTESPRAGFYDGKQREIGFPDRGRSRRLEICGGSRPQFPGLVLLHDCPPPLGIERRGPAKDLGQPNQGQESIAEANHFLIDHVFDLCRSRLFVQATSSSRSFCGMAYRWPAAVTTRRG